VLRLRVTQRQQAQLLLRLPLRAEARLSRRAAPMRAEQRAVEVDHRRLPDSAQTRAQRELQQQARARAQRLPQGRHRRHARRACPAEEFER